MGSLVGGLAEILAQRSPTSTEPAGGCSMLLTGITRQVVSCQVTFQPSLVGFPPCSVLWRLRTRVSAAAGGLWQRATVCGSFNKNFITQP